MIINNYYNTFIYRIIFIKFYIFIKFDFWEKIYIFFKNLYIIENYWNFFSQ